jgi:hypothetical protein
MRMGFLILENSIINSLNLKTNKIKFIISIIHGYSFYNEPRKMDKMHR